MRNFEKIEISKFGVPKVESFAVEINYEEELEKLIRTKFYKTMDKLV